MAFLNGLQAGPVYAVPPGTGGPVNSAPTMQNQAVVIDGTPVRVVTYALAAAAGLWALRLAGFKFNVGVSA